MLCRTRYVLASFAAGVLCCLMFKAWTSVVNLATPTAFETAHYNERLATLYS
jgi:hypothetical protein